jgi:hypothetical protein
MLISKDLKFRKLMRTYNWLYLLFLLIPTTFQQWYLIGLFATLMWQKPRTIKSIIAVTTASEIANTIYMFKSEYWIYDSYFIIGIFILVIVGIGIDTLIKKRLEKGTDLLSQN